MNEKITEYIDTVIEGDCLDVMKKFPDNSIDLIIADPPYFKVKGKFDFVWDSFESFLNWFELNAKEWKRILKKNGSLYCFGSDKRIAYKQIILDKYFTLKNNLVWYKIHGSTANRTVNILRSFMPTTERILFYVDIDDDNFLDEYCLKYLRNELKKSKLSQTKIDLICGTFNMTTHWFNRSQWELPTEEKYKKLQTTGFFKKPYKELREIYERNRRIWKNEKKLKDVLFYSNESNISVKYDHPTIKPLTLIQDLILCSSDENSIILDPFLGSGTTALACKAMKRHYIGIEIEKKYVELSRKRIRYAPVPMF